MNEHSADAGLPGADLSPVGPADLAVAAVSGADAPAAAAEYPSEVRIVEVGERRFVLVGTAHVAQLSVELVQRVVEQERPECVCVELDARRYEALNKEDAWDQLDLRQIIRQNQVSTLLLNLLLGAYQKKLGKELGVKPGAELLEATRIASRLGIPYTLCDRDVRVTLRRAIAATPFWRRLWILSELLASMFEPAQISEQDLEQLRQQDVLSELMNAMGQQHPELKRVLIDERDAYLTERIRQTPGDHLVAVVGAGHLEGIETALRAQQAIDLTPLDVVPPVKKFWHVLGWSVPALILGSLAWILIDKGAEAAGDNLIAWALAGSIPSTIGALLALSHPLTILAAFIAAPFCILSPLIGTAHVTALVQAWVQPPRVTELHNVADDIGKLGQWWRNRVLRVLMAYILPGIGSMIGSVLGFSKLMAALFS
jgi:pheromone shutdown-related protein TraB